MCKNTDTCTHINHLGTRLCVQLWGKTRKVCMCVCICAVAACSVCVCVLTGSCSLCISILNSPPSTTTPSSSLPLLLLSSLSAASVHTVLLFTTTPPYASVFSSSSPVSIVNILFLKMQALRFDYILQLFHSACFLSVSSFIYFLGKDYNHYLNFKWEDFSQ